MSAQMVGSFFPRWARDRRTASWAAQWRPVRMLAVAVGAAAALAVLTASASAAVVHPFLSSFDGSGTPAGRFFPFGVAVDGSSSPSSGDVYVTDTSSDAIDKFSASGSYVCQITGAGSASTSTSECDKSAAGIPGGAFGGVQGQNAVGPTGTLYVADTSGEIDEFDTTGKFLTQLQMPNDAQPLAVALDAAGNVFVADAGNDAIEEYNASSQTWSTFASSTPSGAFGLPAGVAVDDDPSSPAFGDVYVVDLSSNVVDVFSASGSYLSRLTGAPSGDFTFALRAVVDPSSGDLYVTDGANVDEFNASGAFITQTPLPNNGTSTSAAVEGASGDLFVADENGVIDVFGPAAEVPDATTGQPADVTTTGATLSGHVDPAGAGNVTACQFEYGTSTSYGQTAVCSPATPYTAGTDVTASVTGLSPDTTYHFRLDATNANGTNHSTDATFETAGPPTVDGEAARAITRTGATLQAQIDPHGIDTTYHFEYGTADCSTNPCTSVPVPPAGIGEGMSDVAVSQAITGLTLGTTYHYRVVATNSQGTVDGSDQSFTTEPVAAIDSQTAVAKTTSATLIAKINPLGLDTTCEVQYVSAASFESSGYADATSLPCSPKDLGSGMSDQTATVRLTGLAVGSSDHYRFIATNSSGRVTGSDQTFATWGLSSFSFALTDENGKPYTQAGGHPFELTTSFTLNANPTDNPRTMTPDGTLKDVVESLPVGLIGNPTAVPQCPESALNSYRCSGASEIGTITTTSASGDHEGGLLFNLVPPPGVPAEFGAAINLSTNAFITADVRTGSDYGIDAESLNIAGIEELTSVSITMWGEPASPAFDSQRQCPVPGSQTRLGYEPPPCSSGAPLKPFLTDPTSCSGPQQVGLKVDSYEDPGDFASASTTLPGFTNCGALDFSPSITVQPDTSVADSPSGLSVDLRVPQNQNPDGLAEADLKDATVTLPAGVSVDPSAANGLTACTPAQIGIDNANEPACPDSSKLGTVEVDTPLLPDPLKGSVYVAEQNHNPFNSLLAVYVTAQADGTLIKLAGHVVADPVTGQLTTTFVNNPQLPFTDFKLDFFGGPHGVLATPEQCGTYTSQSSLSPWSGAPAVRSSNSFAISSGCVAGFAPSFTAGAQNPQAGAFSPFVVSFSRSDAEQDLSGLSVKLPPGMLAKLAGVQECPDAQLAATAGKSGTAEQANPSCPVGSQVGTVTTTAGAGPDPTSLTGKAYLTGPYKGGPYGLAVVVPAVAGPYDLGTVVVRQALHIDPTTAQVTDVSDAFPTILQGIPLRIRRVDVDLNRSNFTVNPTSCNPMAVAGALSSTTGLTANMSSRFQVGGCSSLGFSPKLKLALTGKGRTHSGNHPTLTATLTDPVGQANIRQARVALPLSLALDPNNSQHVCNYQVAQAVHGGSVGCPASTIVGRATAVTPLLSQPLSGPVYLVQGIRFGANGQPIHTLPSLLIPLRGQIALDLRAQSAVSGGKLVTTFSAIPDAPVSKFTLQIAGGPKGLLVITGRGKTICRKKQMSNANFGAQSGKTMSAQVTMGTPCPRVKRSAKHKHKHKKHPKTARRGVASPTVTRLRGG